MIIDSIEDYNDAPTTPMSDVTELSYSTTASNNKLSDQQMRRIFNNVSSSNLIHDHTEMDIINTARHLQDCKQEVQELRYFKDRFQLVEKHVQKIKKQLELPPIPSQFPIPKQELLNHGFQQIRDRTLSQRTMMTETKLSSQLIRLESLIKTSIEDQHELVAQLESFKEKREVKDARYNGMLATVCKVKDATKFLDSISD